MTEKYKKVSYNVKRNVFHRKTTRETQLSWRHTRKQGPNLTNMFNCCSRTKRHQHVVPS